ncbi:hypothetical protein [Morganella morganii]|uniref:hypothetical protein n=1 Tax=Morganella morganii TaxID=582 RepID=UPI0013B3A054|nr:hypothetical protein [Morganella morganii]
MNDVYYTISHCHNHDSCVYMTTDNHQDFTTLPPEPGKTIIYFTSKKLAEKYIKNIINNDKLCVKEIKNKDVNRLEWICCYDYNIPFEINFLGIILLGFFMTGACAFIIWAMPSPDDVKNWIEEHRDIASGLLITLILLLSIPLLKGKKHK